VEEKGKLDDYEAFSFFTEERKGSKQGGKRGVLFDI